MMSTFKKTMNNDQVASCQISFDFEKTAVKISSPPPFYCSHIFKKEKKNAKMKVQVETHVHITFQSKLLLELIQYCLLFA